MIYVIILILPVTVFGSYIGLDDYYSSDTEVIGQENTSSQEDYQEVKSWTTVSEYYQQYHKREEQDPKHQEESRYSILDRLGLSGCRVTQDPYGHLKPRGKTLYGYDIACIRGQAFNIFAPDYFDNYQINEVGYDNNLGNYIRLNTGSYSLLFGHTATNLKQGDRIQKGQIIGKTDQSGDSRGIHLHLEHWKDDKNIISIDDETASPDSKYILDKRKEKQEDTKDTNDGYLGVYHLTRYYSPEVGQTKYYINRSYDIEMNCGGNQEEGCKYPADGKLLTEEETGKVFACPRNIKLGSKLRLDFHRGSITGTCRDRGGAIKGKRLDVRCGYGDQGVDNILQGKNCNTGSAKVYLIDNNADHT